MLVQLDLFKEYTEVELLEEKIRLLEKSLDRQRKSLYARHNALEKRYIELNDRFEIMERMLCKGKYGVLN